ncbi:MAG: DNA-processing protein DprA [Candidatus Saganbacteria bacterium]|nr:DNA-processing protein DprA [Candidatus Saganbacteria bacterium]
MYTYTLTDELYPYNLKQIYDPPKVLYVDGDIREEDKLAIAIVGTRQPSSYGLETARKFAKELAGLGITIVSGLALGIDSAAHEGALEAGGRTIAVLGHGLNMLSYSKEKFAKKIAASGAVISEFEPDFPADKWTFPRRNRIISGLSLGVIVVEGAQDSGSLITARLALEQGREVFAVPGRIDSEIARGPHSLIKEGAKLIEKIEDVLEEIEALKSKLRTIHFQGELDFSNYNPEERKILETLKREPQLIDKLSMETKLESGRLAVVLIGLEMKRRIKKLPGQYYSLA